MENEFGALDASIQEKIEADAEFNASLEGLSDDDKTKALQDKRSELFSAELKRLKDEAEGKVKSDELAKNQKIRAEKAERELKALLESKGASTGDPSSNKPPELSAKDAVILGKANVHEDDIDDVIEWATFKKISVSEALKSDHIKSLLASKQENRKTAEATNTTSTRRGPVKMSSEALLSKTRQSGELPDSEEDIARLMTAKQEEQRK